jgi:hypothetical protein
MSINNIFFRCAVWLDLLVMPIFSLMSSGRPTYSILRQTCLGRALYQRAILTGCASVYSDPLEYYFTLILFPTGNPQ